MCSASDDPSTYTNDEEDAEESFTELQYLRLAVELVRTEKELEEATARMNDMQMFVVAMLLEQDIRTATSSTPTFTIVRVRYERLHSEMPDDWGLQVHIDRYAATVKLGPQDAYKN